MTDDKFNLDVKQDPNDPTKFHVSYTFVSTSGFGDGNYDAFTACIDGQIVGVKIVFIRPGERE